MKFESKRYGNLQIKGTIKMKLVEIGMNAKSELPDFE